MNRVPGLLLLLICTVLLTASCTKPYKKPQEVPPVTVNPGGPSSFPVIPLNELFKDFRYGAETQCITAGVLDTVTFARGTKLIFYPWSFKDAAGDTITTGTVCVSVTEMYKPGDMIQNRTTATTRDGDLLRSGGQVYVSATQDGQKVYPNKYGILFKQPETSVNRMDLYYGSPLNKDSLTVWAIKDSTAPGVTALATTIDSFYIFDSCTSFSWVNCDRLFDTTTPRTDLNISISNPSFDAKNTMVYVVFPSINSVAAASYSKATGTFLLGGDARRKVPTEMTVHVIVVAKSEGNYYYYELKGATVTTGMYISATLTRQTFDYVRARLWAL